MKEEQTEEQAKATGESLQQSDPQQADSENPPAVSIPLEADGAAPGTEATPTTGDMTLAEVVRMIAEAESKGYERGRREGAEEERKQLQHRSHRSMWEDRHLTDAEEERQSRLEIDNEFLTRIRPTAWD
ncbi:hypothetical protein [Paramuribaculum intestinale]|jgi:hypothetical protein|uniref:hypothetical protein n=1 Tax=Paramuribaculum intestinale TaxID=2094151 RepID=UPI0025B66ABE|nr:hypothetical protein [Paramuribaculum intestinale]